MQIAWFVVALGLLAQSPAKNKPRDITVTGCLEGSYLEVTTSDTSGSYVDRFRLRGNKDKLKALTKEHKGHEIEITGTLIDPGGVMGKGKTVEVGKKTTITTQGRERTEQTAVAPGDEPSIDVKSYRYVGVCK